MKPLLIILLIALYSNFRDYRNYSEYRDHGNMAHLTIRYYNELGETATGEIVCNPAIVKDLTEIFSELYKAKYRFTSIRPISEFGNDDEQSMSANNTSCYCYRRIKGRQKLSKHAQGMAIDINPLYNPCIKTRNGKTTIQPANGAPYAYDRNPQTNKALKNSPLGGRGAIHKGDLVYRLFIAHGFRWGGSWRSSKDYQHFEK